mmetsp:Transcript_80445/g.250008  ORF Transcript_80445/g.250008 Transcript_80445/m.250008 type:complete len:409 (-) Transcript_80445:530-1756(-)
MVPGLAQSLHRGARESHRLPLHRRLRRPARAREPAAAGEGAEVVHLPRLRHGARHVGRRLHRRRLHAAHEHHPGLLRRRHLRPLHLDLPGAEARGHGHGQVQREGAVPGRAGKVGLVLGHGDPGPERPDARGPGAGRAEAAAAQAPGPRQALRPAAHPLGAPLHGRAAAEALGQRAQQGQHPVRDLLRTLHRRRQGHDRLPLLAERVAAGAGADGGGQPLLRRRLPALPGAACSGHPGVHLRWHRDHRPREAGGLRLRPWHPPGRGGQLLAEARGRGRPIHDRLPHGQVCEDSAARQSRQGGHAGGGEDPAAAGLQPAQGGGLGGGAGLADERALRHPAAQPLPVHPGDHAGDLRELPLRRRGRADALAERRARRRLPGACAGRGQPGGDLGRAGRHLAGHLGHRPAG